MEKSIHALSEHEVFIREFLSLYKQQPVLWQQKHPHYRNRAERTEAYTTLVKKCQEYYSDADEDFVRLKIDSMRSTFRKERRKVLQSKESSTNPEDVYKPSLWYYDLLLFTAGEEPENETTSEERSSQPEYANSVKIPFWSREYSAILINFYKNYPCLYTTHPHYKNKKKREDGLKAITEKLKATTGKYFHATDVRRKIALIRGQFLHEYKKVKSSGDTYKPTLWCYEMLSFLTDIYTNKNKYSSNTNESRMNLRRKRKSSSDDSDEDMNIKKESDSSLSSDSVHIESKELVDPLEDDIFDTTGRNFARILREMSDEQRTFANKIIRDVMYHGQMEQLTAQSRFTLNGS